MAIQQFKFATTSVGEDHGEIVINYDDSDSNRIVGIDVNFNGQGHIKVGNPSAKRHIVARANEVTHYDLSRGKRFYLLDTEEGPELEAELLNDIYIVLENLGA